MKKFLLFTCFLLIALPIFSFGADKAILKIGVKDEPDNINPLIGTYAALDYVTRNVYNYLIDYDNELKHTGILAESWKVDKSGLVWTFKLRKGIKWFDGETFNADDVIWTYSTLMNSEFPQSVQLSGVTKIEKIDDYTIKMITEQPKADMEAIRVDIMPEHIYGKKSPQELTSFVEKNPVGTGPFELVEYKQGEFIRLKANENYFQGRPGLDEIIYVIFANTDTLQQALIAGEIDIMTNVAQNQVNSLKNNPDIEVVQSLGRKFTELGFNSWNDPKSKGNPLLLDYRIRKAADYALNKKAIVKISLNGFGNPGTSLLPPSVGDWHWEPVGDELHEYNPTKAKEILEEAGYIDRDNDGVREDKDGNKLSFRFAVISKYDHYIKSANMIKKYLQDVGIEVKISTMDGGAQSDLIYSQDFNIDMYLWGWGTDLDPSLKLSILTTEQIGKRSDCFFSDAEYDKLFYQQMVQVNRAERLKTVHAMQKIAYEKAPYIILYNRDNIEAYRTDRFTGWIKVPAKIGPVWNQVNNATKLNLKLK